MDEEWYESTHTGKEIDDAVDAIASIKNRVPTNINVDEDGYLVLEDGDRAIKGNKKVKITDSIVMVQGKSDFPSEGKPDILYIALAEKAFYMYDTEKKEYCQVVGDIEKKQLIINGGNA